MIEADHTRSVRVAAPIDMVWDELGSLDRLMKQIPEVAYVRLEPDGRTAHITTSLAWGPISWKFANVSLAVSRPPHQLQWCVHASSLQLDFEGTFDLAPAAVRNETLLTYRGSLRCRHRLLSRLRGALASSLEGHVNSLTERLAVLAAQHTEAKARLGLPPDPELDR